MKHLRKIKKLKINVRVLKNNIVFVYYNHRDHLDYCLYSSYPIRNFQNITINAEIIISILDSYLIKHYSGLYYKTTWNSSYDKKYFYLKNILGI
jgi:hypothetical protein